MFYLTHQFDKKLRCNQAGSRMCGSSNWRNCSWVCTSLRSCRVAHRRGRHRRRRDDGQFATTGYVPRSNTRWCRPGMNKFYQRCKRHRFRSCKGFPGKIVFLFKKQIRLKQGIKNMKKIPRYQRRHTANNGTKAFSL